MKIGLILNKIDTLLLSTDIRNIILTDDSSIITLDDNCKFTVLEKGNPKSMDVKKHFLDPKRKNYHSTWT